jgi:hypothetical protein
MAPARPVLIHAIVDRNARVNAASTVARECFRRTQAIMSKSNPIYMELVYVLMAVVVAVAIRVNLPKPSAPEFVAVPCACTEI